MMDWLRKNDIMLKLLSLACAVLLWLYVISSTNPDMTQTYSRVAVDLLGTESLTANNLVITDGSHSTVSFKVTGKSERIAMVSENGGLTVTADLSNITVPGVYDVKYQVISSISDLTISKITPTISIEVDRVVSQSIPVDLQLSGELQDGFVSDNFVLTPDAITVRGPEKLLDTIKSAVAVFDVSTVKTTTETTLAYTLVDENGIEIKNSLITADTPSVRLSYGVRQVGEVPLVLNVNSFGFITSDFVDVSIEPSSIKVSGSPDVVSTLNRIDLGSVNLEQVFDNENFEFDLPVVLPNGIAADTAVTQAHVTITPKELVKTTVEISRDALPQNDLFQYESDLTVTVWTTQDNLASVGASSLNVALSYSEDSLEPGLNEIQASVTPADSKVVVVGDYSVMVGVS